MPARRATSSHLPTVTPRLLVAYFSMEVALDPAMPTYRGGLGVLAGDNLRTAADFGLTMIGITLLSRRGYFRQHLDRDGRQREEPAPWPVAELLEPTPAECRITLEGQPVAIRAWRYELEGAAGAVELFREARETAIDAEAALEGVKRLCIFTTHTPVPVGHDRFAPALVDKVLGGEPLATLRALGCCDTELNMTQVACAWATG